jgi:hypothetical protein
MQGISWSTSQEGLLHIDNYGMLLGHKSRTLNFQVLTIRQDGCTIVNM